MVSLIRGNYSTDDVSVTSPIMLELTDGGPDHCNTYASVQDARSKAEGNPTFKAGLIESAKPVLEILTRRFSELKLKGDPVHIHQPASEDAIQDFLDSLAILDESITRGKLTQSNLQKSERISVFMAKHCQKRQYSFQIKKCRKQQQESCWYCSLQPPRLPGDKCESLHFFPDQVVDPESKVYRKFSAVYGTVTTEDDRPPLRTKQDKENTTDKKNRKLLVAAKVRSVIKSVECEKPRCIYAPEKLKGEMKVKVKKIKGPDRMYTCGGLLCPAESGVVVREGITCASPVEAQYYVAVLHRFPPVCIHCGLAEMLVGSKEIQALKDAYTTVCPICQDCHSKGIAPVVREAKNVGKRQTSTNSGAKPCSEIQKK